MFTYSTCSDCGDLLIVTSYNQTAHPGCKARVTRMEYMAQEFLIAAAAGDDAEADRLEALIDEADSAPPRLTEAAGLYASWGWPVFPLKAPCGPTGCGKCAGGTLCAKRPASRHGFKDATTDADRIFAWWSRHPRSNIGLATGHAFDVIDVDGCGGPSGHPVAGVWALHKLEREAAEHVNERGVADGRGRLPDCHGRAMTASGGVHLYVRASGRGNKAALRPGIDYRGLGGYVVAPPSTLGERGRSWSWAVKPSPVIVGVTRG